MELEVTGAVIDRLLGEAARRHPEECCGLLLGRAGLIDQAVPAANVSPEPLTRFEIDARVLLRAHREARQGGPRVLGYYHSHPGGDAVPSAVDCQNSTDDSRIWAIIARGQVAFWRESGKGFQPQAWRLVEGGSGPRGGTEP